MLSQSYTGNGKTTEFYFNFPFFDTNDIVVTINNMTATTYNIITTPGGTNPDIPYSGGSVVFDTAPSAMDIITIRRHLPLARIVDYQPTSHITPTLLNQDLNYIMEIAKDFRDKIVDIETKYSAIIDQESTQDLLTKFTTIRTEISNFNTQLSELGDIGAIQQKIKTNTDNISNLTEQTNGLDDYVTEYQKPTAANNYTWYRKYKSGWVEQGGLQTGSAVIEHGQEGDLGTITLPVKMKDTSYCALASGNGYTYLTNIDLYTTLCKFVFGSYTSTRTLTYVRWYICGQSA